MQHVYTIVVQPDAEDEGHIAVVPDLPGWSAAGRTVEECVAHAQEMIGLVVGGLAPPSGPREPSGRAADPAEEEALDALRRAMAALRTVETDLEDEIVRAGGDGRAPLRRVHGAVLRARHSLADEERRALDRVLDHATV